VSGLPPGWLGGWQRFLGTVTALARMVSAARKEGKTMELDHRFREAETRLFARSGLQPEESFFDLPSAHVRLRVLSVGAGPPLVMLHGVSLAAGIWAPWLPDLPGYQAHLVELPGHGLSGPQSYRVGAVRGQALSLMTTPPN
jgi:hypothetical protein